MCRRIRKRRKSLKETNPDNKQVSTATINISELKTLNVIKWEKVTIESYTNIIKTSIDSPKSLINR